jgi:SAM-dependent methyltransferase
MDAIADCVRAYYSGTAQRYGATPRGVDWTSAASQYLRFVQLLKACDFSAPFSLNDFGCGYGALLEFLDLRHPDADVAYRGIDISPVMIDAARRRWRERPRTRFSTASRCDDIADYTVASGVFNVRLGQPLAAWENYIESIIANLYAMSRIGFAVNFMLPRDAQPMERELYRTDPERWVAYCESLGCNVKQVCGYGMREFTLVSHPALTVDGAAAAGISSSTL